MNKSEQRCDRKGQIAHRGRQLGCEDEEYRVRWVNWNEKKVQWIERSSRKKEAEEGNERLYEQGWEGYIRSGDQPKLE